MSILSGLVTQLLHLALILALAPVLTGCVRWLKARLMGRRGPHPLQPWRDLLKLLKKPSETSRSVFLPWVKKKSPAIGLANS